MNRLRHFFKIADWKFIGAAAGLAVAVLLILRFL